MSRPYGSGVDLESRESVLLRTATPIAVIWRKRFLARRPMLEDDNQEVLDRRDREGDCPMIRRHRQNAPPAPAVAANRTTPFDDLHEWVLSLPWVVERPVDPENPEMRSFA